MAQSIRLAFSPMTPATCPSSAASGRNPAAIPGCVTEVDAEKPEHGAHAGGAGTPVSAAATPRSARSPSETNGVRRRSAVSAGGASGRTTTASASCRPSATPLLGSTQRQLRIQRRLFLHEHEIGTDAEACQQFSAAQDAPRSASASLREGINLSPDGTDRADDEDGDGRVEERAAPGSHSASKRENSGSSVEPVKPLKASGSSVCQIAACCPVSAAGDASAAAR